jgi:hypothetical protein
MHELKNLISRLSHRGRWCPSTCACRVSVSVLKEVMRQVLDKELANATYQVCDKLSH